MMNALAATPLVILRIVIDANVLAYAALAKLILRLAREESLIQPFWGAEILAETWRTLAVKLKHGNAYADAHLAEITEGFADALQTDLEPLITTQKTAMSSPLR